MEATGELRATQREHARLGTEPIDGLRGFAVMLVVFYHTWLFSWLNPVVPFFGHEIALYRFVRPGHLGVDIFFVVSAFCLTYPYMRAALAGKALPTLREFAIRRFIKIVPSYALVLVVTMLVSAQAGSVQPDHWGKLILEHALFFQNFEYDQLGHDNSVLWSLAVEVQFYVIFPLVMWLFLRSPLLTTLVLVAAANAHRLIFAGCCLHDEDVMRLLPAYLDLFAVGMLAAWAVVWLPRHLPYAGRTKPVFTLAAIGSAYAIYAMLGNLDDATYVKDSREWFSVDMRTIFGLAIGAFAVTSCLGYRWWQRLIGNPVLAGLSLVSYNVYLWHTLIELFLAHHNLPPSAMKEPHEDPHWPLPFVMVSFASIAVVCTAITYFIERPLLGIVKPQGFSFDYARFFGSRAVAGHADGADAVVADTRLPSSGTGAA